jgi:hypothetical protein
MAAETTTRRLSLWSMRVAALLLVVNPGVLLIQAYRLGDALGEDIVGGLWRRLAFFAVISAGLLYRQQWAWLVALLLSLSCGTFDLLSMLMAQGGAGIEMTPLRDYGETAGWLAAGSQVATWLVLLLGGRSATGPNPR